MDNRILRLDEFIAEHQFWGEWEISYTDGTHLPKHEYVKLGDCKISTSKDFGHEYPVLPFEFRPVTDDELRSKFTEIIECRFSKVLQKEVSKDDSNKKEKATTKKSKTNEYVNSARKNIREQLAESLVRTGLLRSKFCLLDGQVIETNHHRVMRTLSDHINLLIVTDTGALRRAAISFLHKTLPEVLIWTVVPVFVMNEVQRQMLDLDKIWRESGRGTQPHPGKCNVLRKRPQVSCISQELDHIRQWRPVEMLTTLHEHLGQSSGQSIIDRLIIESMKNLKRDRGIHQGVYLLTGDKDMASLATLENQGCLLVEVPLLPSTINSVRYNPYKSQLVLTPIHSLLWDLALVFGNIRVESKELSLRYELDFYSREFLAHNVMGIKKVKTNGPDLVE